MSWVATAGGVILGPIAGALATRFVCDAAKPKAMTSTLFIGAAVHAAVAFGADAIANHSNEPNIHAFAYGSTWGNGISSGLLAAGGLYFMTDAGKAQAAQVQALANALNPPPVVPAAALAPPPAPAPAMVAAPAAPAAAMPPVTTSGLYDNLIPAPKGLLGLLTAARAHGYV